MVHAQACIIVAVSVERFALIKAKPAKILVTLLNLFALALPGSGRSESVLVSALALAVYFFRTALTHAVNPAAYVAAFVNSSHPIQIKRLTGCQPQMPMVLL